jgi:multidrug efflux pump subunit AcrA (membrane-fusion protein)
VQASFDALPGREFSLEIVRAWPELDRRLRTRVFETRLPSGVEFSPGMFARVRARLQEIPAALTVPVEAVLDAGADRFVFIAIEDTATRRRVVTGFEQDGRVWIREGLQTGERVIVGGIERVKDVAAIRLEGGKQPAGPAVTPATLQPAARDSKS